MEAHEVEARRVLRLMNVGTLVVWSMFPLVWLASAGGLLDGYWEAIAWGLCDFTAKVVFSSHLWQSNMVTLLQRRKAAQAAWEDANRYASSGPATLRPGGRPPPARADGGGGGGSIARRRSAAGRSPSRSCVSWSACESGWCMA